MSVGLMADTKVLDFWYFSIREQEMKSLTLHPLTFLKIVWGGYRTDGNKGCGRKQQGIQR